MQKSSNAAIAFGGMYASFIGIWIILLLVNRIGKENRKFFSALKPNKARWKISVGLGLLLGFGLNLVVGITAQLLGEINIYFDSFNPLPFIFLLICVFIQSGAEELALRWFLYQRLSKYFPKTPQVAILVNALIFMGLHAFNGGVTIIGMLHLLFTGVICSLLVYYFDSFWGAVIAHTGWNFCQSILLGLPNSGIVSAYSVFKLDAATAVSGFAYDVNFGIEGSLMAIIMQAIICIALVVYGEKKLKAKKEMA